MVFKKYGKLCFFMLFPRSHKIKEEFVHKKKVQEKSMVDFEKIPCVKCAL